MSQQSDAAERLANAVRMLIEQMMQTEESPETYDAAAADVQAALDKLRAGGGYPRAAHTETPRGDYTFFFSFSPISGVSNPIAPPMKLEFGENEVRGTCVLGRAYEGPPGYVHGAFVAALFDELLGVANAAGGSPAMTGMLEVRYHKPTPLNRELRLVGRHKGAQGRKSYATGEIYVGDEITAEAKGTFVAVTLERAKEIFGKRVVHVMEKESA